MRDDATDKRGVETGDEVDRPDWAQQYEIGDGIMFHAPPDGNVHRDHVAGFSTVNGENYGCPVIIPDNELKLHLKNNPAIVVVTEEYHVAPEEVPADE